MDKKKIFERTVVFLTVVFIFTICTVEANGKTKDYFLGLGTGARALGMGSAFCAVADDASAVYWNPAGLELLSIPEITGLHINLWEGASYDTLNCVYPLGKIGSFGFGVIRHSKGDIEKRQGPLDETTTFGVTQMGFFASYSREILKKLSGGISLKGVDYKIDTYRDQGFGMDLGFLYPLPKNLSIGVNLQNVLAPSIKLKSEEDKYPLNAKIGIAYSAVGLLPRHKNKINFAVDLDKTDGVDEIKQHYGFEYWFRNSFALRGGYNDVDSFTGGLGIMYRNFQCDYAFAPHELGGTHRFSFTTRFGYIKDSFGYTQKERERSIQREREKEKRAQKKAEAEKYYKEGCKKAKAKDYQSAIEIWNKKALPWVWISEDKKLEKKIKNSIWKAEKERGAQKKAEAEKYYKEGCKKAKAKDYQSAIEIWNKKALPWVWIGKDKKLEEKIKDSIWKAEREIDKEKEARFFAEGIRLAREEKYLGSYKKFKQVLAINPNYLDAKLQAEEMKKKMMNSGDISEGAKLHFERGLEIYLSRMYDVTIGEWEKAFRIDPDFKELNKYIEEVKEEKEREVPLHTRLGNENYQKKEYLQAIEEWKQALASNPENEELKEKIARVKGEMNDLIRKQLAFGKNELENRNLVKAMEHFIYVLRIDPNNGDAKKYIELIENKLEQAETTRQSPAKKTVIKKTVTKEQVDSLLKEAEDYYFNYRYEKAIEVLNKILDADPDNNQARKFLERVQRVKGK